jgi:hypothetical protein
MEQQETDNPIPASQNVAMAMAPPLCMLAPMEGTIAFDDRLVATVAAWEVAR